MMLGKPVIVAKGTGIDELVKQYNLGFVVEYGGYRRVRRILATAGSVPGIVSAG